VLILDMIEVLPPLEKYKYDIWRIHLVKCYIDNSVSLRSCIRNVNKHFWHRCRGESQYLLSVYGLNRIILASIISLVDLFASLCVVCGLRKKSNCRNPRMSFKQLVGESIADAWERYHLFVADLPVTRMEDCDFTQGFYYGLSQEAKEHIDNPVGGTFFLLKTQEARALFEKIIEGE
jgi:hypothetical protein